MSSCPVQAYLVEQNRPRWWCLQSRVSGKLILSHTDDEGEMVGNVLVFWDRDEAEAAAVSHRETYPGLLIDAVPLPATPPSVVRPKPSDLHHIIAAQTAISLGDQVVQVEVRPTTGDDCTALMKVLAKALRSAAEAEPGARMAPVTFIKLGPRSKQADTINKVA